jgi:hypothetical protein
MKRKTTTANKARCCGTLKTEDGTFHCDRKPVAAYTWDGVPFLYFGKPGAATCDKHQPGLYDAAQYPNLKLLAVLKKPKTLAEIKEDPRVTDLSDERGNNDGVWAYLVAGWQSSMGTHQVAEDTVKEACEQLAYVKPCACADCVNEAKTGEGLPMFVKTMRKFHEALR